MEPVSFIDPFAAEERPAIARPTAVSGIGDWFGAKRFGVTPDMRFGGVSEGRR